MRRSALVLLFPLLFFASDAAAQKLYRWTDKDGKVHYTDQLPPEAAKDEREQLNQQGVVVERTERALTAEEKAARAEDDARAAEQRRIDEEKAKMDAVLVGSYPSEADLQRSYKERFDLIEQSLESARVSIRSQEKSLADLLAHAADLERNGKPVNQTVIDSITRTRAQVAEQRGYLQRREAEGAALRAEFDALVKRYRELKGLDPVTGT
ncbi:DUF4124 domain-containing protein [Chiayiivirga flava]|uniref:DUF4124 domain-containing protein n=1 Tax=Chiayiivirga flava TaxID=659595 RepID=A0A7W8FZS0_9GAMM|nr:DUF4124 domain-containing protein [Chiayiivirga flava]MBB5207504.1 hypothetical protein [Chiayiivirga flava]